MSNATYNPDDDLVLDFSPDAIRAHFGDEGPVCELPDAVLREVGTDCLWDEALSRLYHLLLTNALRHYAPHIPEQELR